MSSKNTNTSHNTLSHQDFLGSVHFDGSNELFYGKLLGITDLVTFEGTSVAELKKAFQEAVQDYIHLCHKMGKPLKKSYHGSFNVRIPSDLHQRAALVASMQQTSLNKLVQKALEDYLENK